MNSRRSSSVPETFPHILKTYAKDALRTQPYDLLSWSAAYFRCIADDVEPPTKARYEDTNQLPTHSLTVEYLKVLVKQIGKGYFVERHILQNKWKSLGLLEDDFHRYLNMGGMFHWQQIHWLKLLSVMAATLREDIKSSLTLICELLTENEPGDLAPIPLWMFRACYVCLAQLDCSSDRVSTSDSSVLPDPKPIEIDASQFRQMMLSEWRKYARNKSSEGRFHELFSRITRANRFDEIITILGEFEADMLNDGKMDAIDPKLYARIVREMCAPWKWIDQFLSLHSPCMKSYNYRECHHTDTMLPCVIEVDPYKCKISECKGIGPSVQPQIIDKFLKYFESHAGHEMIDPTQFENTDCPPLA